MQVKLSSDDLALMISETSRSTSRGISGVDQATYFSIMENCTLF